MSRNLSVLPLEALVKEFERSAIEQSQAILFDDTSEANRLYRERKKIEDELKSRPGDQRLALMKLYDHPNSRVRLTAAEATLAIAREAALHTLSLIAATNDYPAAAEARSAITLLESGFYKPK
jgi:HEAT repeat protein